MGYMQALPSFELRNTACGVIRRMTSASAIIPRLAMIVLSSPSKSPRCARASLVLRLLVCSVSVVGSVSSSDLGSGTMSRWARMLLS